MFGLKKKSSAKEDVSNATPVFTAAPSPDAAYLMRVEKPVLETKTFYVNKTVPAVTYSTQFNVTTYAPETYTYVKPGRTVTTPVQNFVTVHPPHLQNSLPQSPSLSAVHQPSLTESPQLYAANNQLSLTEMPQLYAPNNHVSRPAMQPVQSSFARRHHHHGGWQPCSHSRHCNHIHPFPRCSHSE